MRQYHVYLAGPITGLSFDGATNWREEFIKKLPPEIIGLNPLRGKDYLAEENSIQAEYANVALSCAKGITTRDYNDCKRSDLLVVNLLGAAKVSIGTVMEIAWAKAFQVPVVLVMEKTGNIHDHPMIEESVGFRVDSLEEALWLTKVILLPAPCRKQEPKNRYPLSREEFEQGLREIARTVEQKKIDAEFKEEVRKMENTYGETLIDPFTGELK